MHIELGKLVRNKNSNEIKRGNYEMSILRE